MLAYLENGLNLAKFHKCKKALLCQFVELSMLRVYSKTPFMLSKKYERIKMRKDNANQNNQKLYQSLPGLGRIMPPDSNFINFCNAFQSDLYHIIDFDCYNDHKYTFKTNYTDYFFINFTRSGYFMFESYRRAEEEYNSRIAIEKPGCEYQVIQQHPGAGSCTMFKFTSEGYLALQQGYPLRCSPFFTNPDVFCTIVSASAEADFLHHLIVQQLAEESVNRLQVDCIVTELVHVVMQLLLEKGALNQVPHSTKRLHLKTIERAKEFMLENFNTDISLLELARHCYVSPFHFTRLFKQFCSCSPFSYLHQVRLKHAEILIRTTNMPVTDVCFQSGFNRLDYFSSAFSKLYGMSPKNYKRIYG